MHAMRKSYLYATPSRGVSLLLRRFRFLTGVGATPDAPYEEPRQWSAECPLAGAMFFQLMVMVTGVEWLIEPDVPVTINVT
jgi:hypothetical protein